MSTEILKRYIRTILKEIDDPFCGYFSIGDEILYGKWKNKKGKIINIDYDDRGIPVIEVEPIPKGRKANVIIGLYKIRRAIDLIKKEEK